MLSRSVRTLAGRALAASVRPVAIPVARQVAPAIAFTARRSYQEKVLDRESPNPPLLCRTARADPQQIIPDRETSAPSTSPIPPLVKASSARLPYVSRPTAWN